MNKTHRYFFGSLRSIGVFALLGFSFMSPGVTHASEAQDKVAAIGFGGPAKTLLVVTNAGVKKSTDEGETWSRIALPLQADNKQVSAVATSAGDNNSLYLAGSGFGVLHSKDGGQNWEQINAGLPSTDVTGLTVHAEQPKTVYAHVKGEGIFRSQNEGGSWRLMDQGPRTPITHFVHSNMEGSMETGWLFAATSDGVRRSMDCFCGWHRAGDIAGEVHAVAYDPDDTQRVYASSKDGIFVSTNGGEEWSRVSSPASPLTSLVAAPTGVIYGMGKDGLFRSRDQGATWKEVRAQ
jgi:photosystem II stability/assembly factor-like uncharacterized protein